MRFAWLKDNLPDYVAVEQGFTHPLALIRKAYNAAFWIFLLPLLTVIDYGTGFVAFAVIIAVRLAANLYTNNLLQPRPEAYERFPLRV
jgi:hypothetical protein